MTKKRLTDIALLSIENDFSDKISLDDLVTDFSGQDKNRTIILFLLLHCGVVSLINQSKIN